MDWELAIETNRAALRRILLALIGMAGLGADLGAIPALPRRLHRAVLRLLRPAEAAARRLVIVVARTIVVKHAPLRQRTPAPGRQRAASVPQTLPLFDPIRRIVSRPAARRPVPTAVPRISVPGFTPPAPLPVQPRPNDRVDAARLACRLLALGRALDDLPRQAHRLARWRARLAQRLSVGGDARPRRVVPLRGGRPPGAHRPRSGQPPHAVHAVLLDLHGLAFEALNRGDTS